MKWIILFGNPPWEKKPLCNILLVQKPSMWRYTATPNRRIEYSRLTPPAFLDIVAGDKYCYNLGRGTNYLLYYISKICSPQCVYLRSRRNCNGDGQRTLQDNFLIKTLSLFAVTEEHSLCACCIQIIWSNTDIWMPADDIYFQSQEFKVQWLCLHSMA